MKPFAACLATVLFAVLSMADLHSIHAQNAPTIPAWIHRGLVVIYDADSAFVTNGRFSQGIRVVMTTRVNSSSANQVSGVTLMQTVGSPIGGQHAWNCDAGGNCTTDPSGLSGQFWVDPANPTASKRGPNGEPYIVKGSGPYTYGGKTWASTMMVYDNPATKVQFVCTFEAKTGLIVQYSETNPGEQVHIFLRTVTGQ